MSTKVSLADRLSELGKSWKKTEPRKVGAPLPPGEYVFRIETATIETSKKDRLQVKWELTVMEPAEMEGKKVNRWTGIENDDALAFLQGDLQTLEIEIPDDIDDLGDALEKTQGLLVAGAAVKSDEFLNIYFNDLVESADDDKKGKDKKGKNKDEAAAEEPEKPTAKEVKKMSRKEMKKLLKAFDISDDKIDPDSKELEDDEDLAKEIIDVLDL